MRGTARRRRLLPAPTANTILPTETAGRARCGRGPWPRGAALDWSLNGGFRWRASRHPLCEMEFRRDGGGGARLRDEKAFGRWRLFRLLARGHERAALNIFQTS